MTFHLFNATAILLYWVVAFLLARKLHQAIQPNKLWLIPLTLVAAISHGYAIYWSIDAGSGQNLSLFNVFSFGSWLTVLLLLLSQLRQYTPALFLIPLPLAGFAALLASFFPGSREMILQGQHASLLHIFSALVAFSLMTLAAAQAVFILWSDHQLRKHPAHANPLIPPLLAMDRLLFQLLAVGFALLSLSLMIAAFYLKDDIPEQPIHKLLFTVASWFLFAILLCGRWFAGWRGALAARGTLIGFALLLLGYFGSRLVIEIFLGR